MTSKHTICFFLTFIQVNMRFQQNYKEIINILYNYLNKSLLQIRSQENIISDNLAR
jgi:hypothetical protein